VRIHFVLIGEGSSDHGLIPHLQKLCIDAGADEVSGTSPDFRRLPDPTGASVQSKIRATLALEPNANLFFIHRDSDSRDPEPRYLEISSAIRVTFCATSYVAVVPIQETEAWLLLDEQAIRQVAQKPRGRVTLQLPRANRIESLAQPKEHLKRSLAVASELTGRRLARFERNFDIHRTLLLERLSLAGELEQLNSWVRLRNDVRTAILTMAAALRIDS
jgi:hypothetical protein